MSSLDLLLPRGSLLLAPMAGVNDPVFRRICKQHGAALTYSPMVSAAGLTHGNAKTRDLLYLDAAEKPAAVQLFGREPARLAASAAWLEQEYGDSLALIDVNMGCPARKIAGKGDGAALMREPDLAAAILRAVVDAVSLPVTVKFRRGWELGQETAVEFARLAEACGVAALAVHGRYAQQFYHRQACREVVGRVAAAVSVPVLASGDVYTAADIDGYLREQGAWAVMAARGAQGNPWLFAHVVPDLNQRVAVARDHARGLAALEPRNLASLRRHIAWYFKGAANAARIRRQVQSCVTLADYERLLDEIV